jgi:4-amino-4-deoxy-L-arabinose transferase-like glycosyltransferase
LAIDWSARSQQAKPYIRAVSVYVCSRLIILLAVDFAGTYLPLWKPNLWQSGSRWYDHLLRWDSEWYAGIAEHGYRYSGVPTGDPQAVVFYPLYPLLSRFVAEITGISPTVALLVVANIAAVVAVLLLFRMVRRHFDDEVALLSVALLSFYPGSLFLSAGYSEGLALLLILCCFTLLDDRRYIAASVAAGLALATRFVGVALIPVLLWDLWLKFRADRKRFVIYAFACMLIASAGLWTYMLYLEMAFGHPFAFADAQAAFNGDTSLASRLIASVKLQPLLQLRFTDFSPAGLDQWFFFLLLGLTLSVWRRLPGSLTLFSLGALLVPYLTLGGGPAGFTSMTRFGVLAFPAFIVLAELCRRSAVLCFATMGLFGAVLALHSALFAQWYWVG